MKSCPPTALGGRARLSRAHLALTHVLLASALVASGLMATTARAQDQSPATGKTPASTAAKAPAQRGGQSMPTSARSAHQVPPGTIVLASSAKPAQASPRDAHEQQLQAIRQALLDATLDRPTRVMSSAWIDQDGILREAAHFHSEAEVRGVRVLSYVQDGETPHAEVSAEVLPWGLRPGHAADGRCEAPPRPWRLPLLVQARADGHFSGPQQLLTQQLLESATHAWSRQLARSQRWQAQPSPRLEPNTYLRTLSGYGEDVGGWAVEITLTPLTDAGWVERAALQRTPWAPPVWRWALTLNMGLRSSLQAPIQPVVQARQVLAIDSSAGGVIGPQALRPVLEQVEQQVALWAQSLDERSQCEPVRFAVQRSVREGMVLYAGQGSGLRPGDRVLIMNPSHVPSRLLEAGSAQHLALAEVVRVGRLQTELQLLAGPPLQGQGQWVAVPL